MQTYPPAAVRPASAIHAQRTQSHTHYERRRPETTVLHTLVRENIDTFLAQVKTESGSALPHHVEKEFDDYLRCGVLAHGFLRLRCGSCNEEKLVGFSCKGMGFCPSCGARRMAQTAAHLVDQVLPDVPVRIVPRRYGERHGVRDRRDYGRNFNGTWTLPTGMTSSSIDFYLSYTNGSFDNVSKQVAGTATSATLTVSAPTMGLTIFGSGASLYARDAFGRDIIVSR